MKTDFADRRLSSFRVWRSDQAMHLALLPADLPPALAPHGPCLCAECKGLTPRAGSAWHPSHVLSTTHTDDWRRLSYALGDTAADWVCGWVDRQPEPSPAMDAILTIAEAPQDLPRITSRQGAGRVDQHLPRHRVWRYVAMVVHVTIESWPQ